MAKPKSLYRCTECGWESAKWVGRCGECQAWSTLTESGRAVGSTQPVKLTNFAVPITDTQIMEANKTSTKIAELDRVLGGGIVPGSVILLAGEPGIGKSTLLLEVAAAWAKSVSDSLYISAEESAAQVKLRAERIGAVSDKLYLAAETDLATILGLIDHHQPKLVIVDSIQTISSSELDGAAGGVAQVRESAAALIAAAKKSQTAIVLVGHVTKEGTIAGPRMLEHIVDVVLNFDGDRHTSLRILRSVKNRYGATDEIGCFDLAESGLVEVTDPSELFRTARKQPIAGTCLTVSMEGQRPLITELQALVATSALVSPRRATSGVDSSRVAMVLAVLERKAGIKVAKDDCYVATVGGLKIVEPAADLAIALSIASAAKEKPIGPDVIAIGEIGLTGEIRRATNINRRLAEAERLGIQHAIVPSGTSYSGKLKLHQVEDLAAAVSKLNQLEK
ncbi:MAG: DNA repair protein RadA [Candidatus Nanopelagicales bacterium]